MRRERTTGINGLIGIGLNVLAVALLQNVPHTYKPNTFAEWLAESRAEPSATIASSWAFTLGLVALAAFAFGLPKTIDRAGGLFRSGSKWLGLGAMLNAAGTLAPIIALNADDGAARAFLNLTLLLDSSFNFCLGAGLIQLAIGAGSQWPKALRGLSGIAGIASLVVSAQFMSNDAARFLAIAGPLWLTALTWISVKAITAPENG